MSEETDMTMPYPKTVRAKEAERYFGVKRDMLNRWVAEKKVIAFCVDRAVFYDFESINNTIHGLPGWEPNSKEMAH